MKSLKDKISIITICYNAAEIIENTIVSVVNQTYSNLEYIVIDGASSDSTLEIIKKYESRISIILSESDNGIYDAMNKGIKCATGKWILFMNAGDMFYNTTVLEDAHLEMQDNSSVVYGDCIQKYSFTSRYVKPERISNIKKRMVFSHQSVFVSAQTIKKFMFDTSYKLAADYDLLLKMYTYNYSFKYISLPISIVEIDEGATYRNFVKSKKEVLTIHKELGYSFPKRYSIFMSMVLKYYIYSFIKRLLPESVNTAIIKRRL